jgi:hypothetical protein
MSTVAKTKRIAEMSPSFKARMAGVLYLYLITILLVMGVNVQRWKEQAKGAGND